MLVLACQQATGLHLESTWGSMECGWRGDSQGWPMPPVHNVLGIAGAQGLSSSPSFYYFCAHTRILASSVLSVWGSRVHVLGQLYVALQKHVQELHDGEHLTLITCRHHTGCFCFLSSWHFWETWEAGSLHSCKDGFKRMRSLILFTYPYFLVSAMRVSY